MRGSPFRLALRIRTGRHSTGHLVLQHHEDLITARLKVQHERFGFGIRSDGYGHVDVVREARLRSDRHRETADDREARPCFAHVDEQLNGEVLKTVYLGHAMHFMS